MELFINKILNEDSLTGMKKISTNSIDFVLTDPPYGINFNGKAENYNRNKDNVINMYEEIKSHEYYSFTLKWLTEIKKVLKEDGSAMIFSGWTHLDKILKVLNELDFQIINHIIWKYQFGVVTKTKFTSSHYHILYIKHKSNKKNVYFNKNSYYKDDEKFSNGGSKRYKDMEDVWIINRDYIRGKPKAPTKLPSKLVEKILKYCTKENDIVLDPFMGSGEVAIVCKKLNRKYIGFEINTELCNLISQRINGIIKW